MRGRPQSREERHVSHDLLAAAAAGLERKSHGELTAREIASSAGTTQAMIKYYFDGKDGLFSALIRDTLQEIAISFDAIIVSIERDGINPTRRLVETMFRHYASNMPLYRVILEELGNNRSRIRQEYLDGKLPGNFGRLCRIMAAAQRAGIYRDDINLRYATFVLSCLMLGPIALGPAIGHFNVGLEELQGAEWVDFVSRLVDDMLCRR